MKKVYLIGKSLKHSISPLIHNNIYSLKKIDAIYKNVELPDESDLEKFILDVKEDDSAVGFNITIPYKQSILRFCDQFDMDVEMIQAANTVKIENGRLFAFNTDWMGFLKGFDDYNVDLKNKKILVLGAGGAAKACLFGLFKRGVGEVFLANRNKDHAFRIKEQLKGLISVELLDWENKDTFSCQIIVNTTPVGMYPDIDKSPVEKLDSDVEVVYDMIYNPYKTRLLKIAEERGIIAINGLKMLIYQATLSDRIWFCEEIEKEILQKIEDIAKKEIEQRYRI